MTKAEVDSILRKSIEIQYDKRIPFYCNNAGEYSNNLTVFLSLLLIALNRLELHYSTLKHHQSIRNENDNKNLSYISLSKKLNESVFGKSFNVESLYLNIFSLKKSLREFGNYVFEKEIDALPLNFHPEPWIYGSNQIENMETTFQIQKVIIDTLKLPPFAIVEFLISKQSGSIFSTKVFFDFLKIAIDSYYLHIKNEYPKECLNVISLLKYLNSNSREISTAEVIDRFEIMQDSTRNKIFAIKDLKNKADAAIIQIENNTYFLIGLKTNLNTKQLTTIFERLCKKNLVSSSDKEAFLCIFGERFSGRVKWDESITKAGLFDLVQRITGEDISASTLKKYFISTDTIIHDNWKPKKTTKLIDEIMSGI
jgi:hypothetical protein